jgi:hypothetical protein
MIRMADGNVAHRQNSTIPRRDLAHCDAYSCTFAIHAAVLGSDEFRANWSAALAAERTCVVLESQLGLLACEAGLAVTSESEAEVALRLVTPRTPIFVVTDTFSEALCKRLGAPELRVIPPPSDDASRRLVANWMVGRVEQSGLTLCASSVQLAAGLRIDFEQSGILVTSKERSTSLQCGEASLLRYLMLRRGKWTPTAQICSEVYNRTDEAAPKLAWKYVSTLRKKFGGHAGLLETHRSYGYRLRPTHPSDDV